MSATRKNSPDTNAPLSGSEIYEKVQKLTTQGIDQQLKKFFSELSGSTFHHISIRDRERLIAQVQRKQDIILSSLLFQIKNNFADFKASRQFQSQQTLSPNNQVLGLVGTNQYTESEELDSIVQHFQNKYNDYYLNIANQLALCIDRTDVSGVDNPLHAKHLCRSFQSAIDTLNLVNAQKIALYKVFASSVIDKLEPLYIRLEQCFIKYQAPSEHKVVTIESPIEEVPPTPARQNNSLAMSHIPALMGIFQSFKDKSNDKEAVYSELLPELKASLAEKGIVEFDSTLDKLSALFSIIFADEDLPEKIKQQLARLQLFIFMSEIQASGFPVRSSHPARRLIDTIIRTEVDFDKNQQPDRSGYDFLRTEIDKVSSNPFIETDYYAQLCQSYIEHTTDSYTSISSIEPDRVEEPANDFSRENSDIESGETVNDCSTVDIVLETVKPVTPVDKVDNIYAVVQSIVNDIVLPLKMQGRSLILFDEVWFPLLLKVARKQGFKSQAWHKIVTIVKTQAWVLIPKSNQADLDKLKSTLPNIEKSLTQSMQSLSMPAEQQASLLEFLKHEQADIIRQSVELTRDSNPIASKRVQTRQTTVDSNRDLTSRRNDGIKETIDEFSNLMETGRFNKSDDMLEALQFENKIQPEKIKPSLSAANIHKSDWVEIKKGSSAVLAKLTWKNETNSQYIFVDREGQRVCEISGEDLDRELKEGNISLISSTQFRSQRPASSIIQTFN